MKVIKFFLFLILLLFPFGQLTKIPLGIPGMSLYLHDCVVISLLFYWIIWHFFGKKPLLKPPLTIPIFAFIGMAFFSLLVNSRRLEWAEVLISFFYLLRWVAYAGIYFVGYSLIGNKEPRKQGKKILRLLALTGVIVAIFGLFQYFFYPNLRNLYYLGWDPHQYRVFGTFFDPGFTGIILVLTLILLISFSWLEPLLKFGGGLVVFLAIVLTYSRSSYLALIISVFFLTWLKKDCRFLVLPLILLFFILVAIFLPRPAGEGVRLERQSTVLARFENWRQSLKIISDHPFLGVGFNSFRFAKRDYGFLGKDWQDIHSGAGTDSSLLFVFATTGIVGLMSYLWLWWRATQLVSSHRPRSDRLSSPPSEEPPLCRVTSEEVRSRRRDFTEVSFGIVASVIALFVHSFFLNSLFYPWVMIWMWLLLGIVHGSAEALR